VPSNAAGAVKGDLIARILDPANPELPGHLDLLEAALYATHTDAVILEFTTRGPIPEPSAFTMYSYRLYFDTDEPYWPRLDFEDEDFSLVINIEAGGAYGEYGTWNGKVLARDATNRIAISVDMGELSGTSASVVAAAVEFDGDDLWVGEDQSSPTQVSFPVAE